MSNIKMGDWFDLPVRVPVNDNQDCIVADSFCDGTGADQSNESYGDIYFQAGSPEECAAAVIAINSYDANQERIAELEAMLSIVIEENYIQNSQHSIAAKLIMDKSNETT
jgi:hypothetical protein